MENFKELTILEKIKIILSTFFFTGYSPLIPGTAGTAGGLLLYCFLTRFASIFIYISASILLIVTGVWASDFAERFYGRKDPPRVVIDEVAGFLLAMLFIKPRLFNVIIGFVLFRTIDIIKPPPARYFERMEGGVGIMVDDVVSAFYTNMLMQTLLPVLNLI
ncbi:MAG: phosphatidylglycerophosphatase A [Acidobacteriota bacterium]